MNIIKKDVFAISYHVKRLFRGKDAAGKPSVRESAPSQEKTIHVAADNQEQAVEHTKNLVHTWEVGGEKDRENRMITVTGVANGVKAVHVYIAPSAPVAAAPAKPAPSAPDKPLDQALSEQPK